MKNRYLSYATHFVSFLLEEIEIENIKEIILFGSVARNEATKNSDIDLFVNVAAEEKEYKQKIDRVIERFYNSRFFKSYWKIKGIENDFSVIVGKLDEWKELKDSIISSGITLYSKFYAFPEKYSYSVLISFDKIKPESKRVALHKNLSGYKIGKKYYPGLLDKYHGIKINPGTILIPLEHKSIILTLIKKLKITVKIRNIMEY